MAACWARVVVAEPRVDALRVEDVGAVQLANSASSWGREANAALLHFVGWKRMELVIAPTGYVLSESRRSAKFCRCSSPRRRPRWSGREARTARLRITGVAVADETGHVGCTRHARNRPNSE